MNTSNIKPTLAPLAVDDRLLKQCEVWAVVGVSRRTLYRLIALGDFPSHDLKVGYGKRWKQSTITRWIDDQCAGDSQTK